MWSLTHNQIFFLQIFGHISGAHLNPAVTIATVYLGYLKFTVSLIYFLAEFTGAIAGFALLKVSFICSKVNCFNVFFKVLAPAEFMDNESYDPILNQTIHKTGICSTVPYSGTTAVQVNWLAPNVMQNVVWVSVKCVANSLKIALKITLPASPVFQLSNKDKLFKRMLADYGLLTIAIVKLKNCVCTVFPNQNHTLFLNFFQAVVIEAILTTILILVCCAVWDRRNADKPDSTPLRFGFIVAVIGMVAVSILFNNIFKNRKH